MKVTRIVVLAVAAAGAAALAGGPAGGAEEDHEHEVVLRHARFVPAEIEVEVGERVTWRHADGDDPQSVTADDGSFDSHPDCTKGTPNRCMRGGERFSHTFTKEGRVRYHSRTEGGPGGQGMSGVVVVVEEHDHDE